MNNNNLNSVMSNDKKFKKYIDSVKHYKSMMKPEYQKYFDEISALYINRQIVKKVEVEKLLKKFISRGTGEKSAIKLIETKYREQKTIKKEIETFYITVNFD